MEIQTHLAGIRLTTLKTPKSKLEDTCNINELIQQICCASYVVVYTGHAATHRFVSGSKNGVDPTPKQE